jgi:putative heme transporter
VIALPPDRRMFFGGDRRRRQDKRQAGLLVARGGPVIVSVAVIVATFGFAVPKFASYSQVWPILGDLPIAQIVWLVVAQFLNSATYWLVYLAALPGLGFWQAAVLIQANSAMASVLPAGGAFAVGITYQMLVRGDSPTPRSPN